MRDLSNEIGDYGGNHLANVAEIVIISTAHISERGDQTNYLSGGWDNKV